MTHTEIPAYRRRRMKTHLIMTWKRLGLYQTSLLQIYNDEVIHYKENTWAVMYGWFFGEPVSYFCDSAFMNELCACRRGKILMQLAGGYYYELKSGKIEGYIHPKTFYPLFLEESLFSVLLLKIKQFFKRRNCEKTINKITKITEENIGTKGDRLHD